MDDEDDADLYGDLVLGNREANVDVKKMEDTNTTLRRENDQLKQRLEGLMLENNVLTQDKKKLETNLSSLIKTAQTEMKRKDLLIAELRREKDSVVFRRVRNVRPWDNQLQERSSLEPRHEIHQLTPAEERQPVPVPNPPKQSIFVPIVETKETAAVKTRVPEVMANFAVAATKTNQVPPTLFSKRQLNSSTKPLAEVTVPEVKLPEVRIPEVKMVEVKLPEVRKPEVKMAEVRPSGLKTAVVKSIEVKTPPVTTPVSKPEILKKRITPVMISEPTPKKIDLNKTAPKVLELNKSLPKVTSADNCMSKVTGTEFRTPTSFNVAKGPNTEPISISKEKINAHIKASFDTSNSKTTDFKRRVSAWAKPDAEPQRDPSSKSPLKRHPSLVSESSCDGTRKPTNYDLMKRNVKNKYLSLDSPSKKDRPRRSRSRSSRPHEKRAASRSKQARRTDSEKKPVSSSRRKESPRREEGSSKRRVSRRGSSKREFSPPRRESRRRGTPANRRVASLAAEPKNFGAVSTARRDSERKFGSPAAAKSRGKLGDASEKSTAKLDRGEAETEVPKSKEGEVPTVTSQACSANLESPSETTDVAKSKPIEVDGLTLRLTALTAELSTSKTLPAAEPKRSTKKTNGLSVMTSMPIPPRDFLSARLLADYKTPENSTDTPKAMSPPDAPPSARPFSGVRLAEDLKTFSYPFTPLKVAITAEYSFPSMITPLKATPVKADAVAEEDSLDLVTATSENDSEVKLPTVESEVRDEVCLKVEAGDGLAKDGQVDVEKKAAQTKEETDLEDGELTEEEEEVVAAEAPKELEKSNVAFIKARKSSTTERKRCDERKSAAAKVVSPTKMSDLRQKLLARSACLAPPRKDMRDYEIRLKSPFKASARISGEKPAASRSPTARFLQKSPEKSSERSSGRSRSRSPKGRAAASRDFKQETRKIGRYERDFRRGSASNSHSRSRSPKPRDYRDLRQDYWDSRVYRRRAARNSESSGSRSPKRRRSRSRSSNDARKSLAKAESRVERWHVSPVNSPRRQSGSRSKSPSRDGRNRANERPRTKGSVEERKSLRSSSRSRSRSSNDVRKSPAKAESRVERWQVSPVKSARRQSGSRSKSPSRDERNQTNETPRTKELNCVEPERESLRSSSKEIRDVDESLRSSGKEIRDVDESLRSSGKEIRDVGESPGEAESRVKRSPVKSAGRQSVSRSKSPSRDARSQTNCVEPERESLRSSSKENGDVGESSAKAESRVKRSPVKSPRRQSGSRSTSPSRDERNQTNCVEPERESLRSSSNENGDVDESPAKAESRGEWSPVKSAGRQSVSRSTSASRDGRSQTNCVEPERESLRSSSKEIRDVDESLRSSRKEIRDVDESLRSSSKENGVVGESPGKVDRASEPPRPQADSAFRRKKRSFFKPEPPKDVVSPPKVAERRLPISKSGVSSKSVSPPKKTIHVTVLSEAEAAEKPSGTCVFITPLTNDEASLNLPDILSTLGSKPSPMKSSPPPSKSLGDIVAQLCKSSDPELQKCLDAIRAPVFPISTPAPSISTPVLPISTPGNVFRRRSRPVKMVTPSLAAVTSNPALSQISQPMATKVSELEATPTKVSEPVAAGTKDSVVPRGSSTARESMSPEGASSFKSSRYPILEKKLTEPLETRCDSPLGAQFFRGKIPLKSRSGTPEKSGKRKRDLSCDRRKKKKRSKSKVNVREELLQKAKSLFGSDTEEEGDFDVRTSEYARADSDSSEEDPFVSESPASAESNDDWEPARVHRKKSEIEPPSIWPERPEERVRRKTILLEELPKSAEKMIEELMSQASRKMSSKKKRRSSSKASKVTSKPPLSSEFVATDDSD